MAETQAETKPSARNTVRPVVIVDSAMLRNNSVFLERFLLGLASEVAGPAVVCPLEREVAFIPSPPVEVIIHPAFRLPLLGRQNRDKLLDSLEKFSPTVLHCLGQGKARLTKKLAEQ